MAAGHSNSCSLTLPPQPDQGENKIKKLKGEEKDRELSSQLPSQAKQTKFRKK